jgi:hypothetical protein
MTITGDVDDFNDDANLDIATANFTFFVGD